MVPAEKMPCGHLVDLPRGPVRPQNSRKQLLLCVPRRCSSSNADKTRGFRPSLSGRSMVELVIYNHVPNQETFKNHLIN